MKTKRTRHIDKKGPSLAGMTIVEVIVWTAIFAVVATATYTFQRDFMRLNNWAQGGLATEAQVRKVFKDFVNEVRSASTANTGAYTIEAAGANSFIFFADTNGDGLRERIRYFISGSDLKKGITQPTGCPTCAYNPANEAIATVASDITNTASVFSYFDENYDGTQAPLADPVTTSAVRLIKMQLTIDPNGAAPPAAQTFETQASIRNLRQL